MAVPPPRPDARPCHGSGYASAPWSDQSRARGTHALGAWLYGRGGGTPAGGLGGDRARARPELGDEAPRPHTPPCGGARAPARRDQSRVSSTARTITNTT